MADRLIKPMLEGYPVGWFAPTYKVLDDAWLYFNTVLEPLIKKKNETKYLIELVTGGKLECWSTDSGIVARSRKYKDIAVDEAAKVDNLKARWNLEIRPTLVDYEGGAWFGSTPNGMNDFYDMFMLKSTDPEWMSWQIPSWDNPHLPLKERQQMQYKVEVLSDPVARQEYGAEFVSDDQGFVPPYWVDALMLNADHWQPLDPRTSITVGIDVGAKNDLFSITGWGRDHLTRKYKPMFAKLFYPEDLVGPNGGVSFDKPKQFIRDMARGYQILGFAYDPYQCWALADDLYNEGVGIFTEFPQGAKRVLSDSYLYGLIRDRQIDMSLHDEGHRELAQHFKNANAKIEGEDKRRLVKRADTLKIDNAVSSSMSLWHLQEFGV